ncbi:uncharacterized protein [Epargyreus clarus]|uniref:uncharacterized protein n=1 Tax=Epargyreus clarus TaxID=520877 RepID=UPI003C2D2538
MEDETGVKAPVTRLRRRLSVEQSDDAKSSSAPNTPTKKRGGRRAAKPELDLIDENAPEMNTSTRSKKTIVKDIELIEEKPVTPSRRSARIKSNTSIVSETTQGIDSPRAKRAARRTSQVGSDNEAPLTPARQTRRTRKDSASNAEKVETQSSEIPIAPIAEAIVEESEPPLTKSQRKNEKDNEENHSPSGLRKSPRLSLKKNKSINVIDSDNTVDNKADNESEDLNNSNKENETTPEKQSDKNTSSLENRNDLSKVDKNRLSAASAELIKHLNNEPDKNKNVLNKSSSLAVDTQGFKSKRHRSKSWTTLADPESNDNKCYSDSESAKKTRKSLLNNSNCIDMQNNNKLNVSVDQKQIKLKEVSAKLTKDVVNSPNRNEEQKLLSPSSEKPGNTSTLESLFEKDPTHTVQPMVYIDESDSNSEKQNDRKITRDEDQCVPVVVSHLIGHEAPPQEESNDNSFNLNKGNEKDSSLTKIDNKNDSCEPMDVDETIPDNIIPNTSLSKTLNTSKNEVNESSDQHTKDSTAERNKSRKSSLNLSTSQNLEKTANENKSTLVLSQLKDISNENNESQSPQIPTHKILSKSDHALDVTQDDEAGKKNRSLNYLTSTPLQQKSLVKLALQGNTSGITCNNTSKIDKTSKNMEEDVSSTSKLSNKSENSSEESMSGEESEEEQDESNFVDDEAEDAGDDYESGDSKDEDEEQYERENEIIQKGETLTSEDELSNDSDYEKDSFIVSSDEEDNDLLDGSGDDLSMSDNELKMTAKSKQKYNERKMKEQKKASREMFEARHKLNVSNKSNKSESSKVKRGRAVIDSSESEEEDIEVKVKKNNRMRLDSSHETSVNKSLEHNVSTKKDKSLSKSVNNESLNNEVEMTICDENANDDIDPLAVEIKQEPKTPQKKNANTSVKFVDPENMEENEVDKNKSQTNKTLVDDPLEESDEASSDSSDNVHIQNYDSILNELNKNNRTKKNKDGDISLNLDRKTKPKKTVPIVDQLNLTQIKPKKMKKKRSEDEVDSSNKSCDEKSISKKEHTNDDSDDSIDLHLLFSEESNSSDAMQSKDNIELKSNEEESFIPLKESQGKTNMLETSVTNESAKKKNKKRKSLNKSKIDDDECDDSADVQFFIDTTGTHNSTALEKSLNVSTTKKKAKAIVKEEGNSDSDAPVEVSNKSMLEKQVELEEQNNKINTSVSWINKSVTKTPKSDKKKKKLSESLAKEQIDDKDVDTNSSIMEQISQNNIEEKLNQTENGDKSLNKSSTKKSKGQKKRLSESNSEQKDEQDADGVPAIKMNTSIVEEFGGQDIIEEIGNDTGAADKSVNKSIAKTPKSDKKKKKRLSESQLEQIAIEVTTETDHNISLNSSKKQKSDNTEEVIEDTSVNKSLIKTPNSTKKKAKKLSESNTVENIDEIATEQNEGVGSIKKNKKKTSINLTDETLTKEDKNESADEVSSSKKRKRKSSLNKTDREEDVESADTSKTLNVSITTSSLKKKRKISHNVEDSENNAQGQLTNNVEIPKEEKKLSHDIDKTKQRHPLPDQSNIQIDTINTDIIVTKKKGSKKRKEREDDEESNLAKVTKIDSSDKMPVPRLPTSILNQLEDKSKKKNHEVTKPKAISTTNFVVEENKIRKIKPSNYLEESIYIHEDETSEIQKQKRIKNPKVLPFLPTVSTSNSGYTTNFKVNIIPKEVKFVAKLSEVGNFKNDYLQNKKMKRLGTYEHYKRNRNIKMSKF